MRISDWSSDVCSSDLEALFAAFFLSFPIIANQLWAFIAPGLYAKEKRAFLPFLIATPVLFTMGAALAYYVVMPTAFHFFLSFEGSSGGLTLEALPSTTRKSTRLNSSP